MDRRKCSETTRGVATERVERLELPRAAAVGADQLWARGVAVAGADQLQLRGAEGAGEEQVLWTNNGGERGGGVLWASQEVGR